MKLENEKIKVLIAAGGTGGHLMPSQQLASNLMEKRECESFIFAAKGIEKSPYFQKDLFNFKEITGAPLKKSLKGLLLFFYCNFKGLLESLKLFFQYKPDVVVGFGSYHTFPVLLAAFLTRCPIVLYESNCVLGKSNRFFAKKAKVIAVQFPLLEGFLKKTRAVELLPWNKKSEAVEKEQARKKLGLQEDLFTILIFGGSQGADFINKVFALTAPLLKEKLLFQVIHLTGSQAAKTELAKVYEKLFINAFVSPFEKDMALLYSAADLAICRSGASTMGELITHLIPAILIPFPFASENHQDKNADFMEKKVKGAVKISQKKLEPFFLLEVTSDLLSNDKSLLNSQRENILIYKIEENKKRNKLCDIVCQVAKRESL